MSSLGNFGFSLSFLNADFFLCHRQSIRGKKKIPQKYNRKRRKMHVGKGKRRKLKEEDKDRKKR